MIKVTLPDDQVLTTEIPKAFEDIGGKRQRKLIQVLGMDIEGEAKTSIQSSKGSGRVYRRKSVTHRASSPGQTPVTDSGDLVSSISSEVANFGHGVRVGSTVRHGRYLEEGTKRMAKRPWLEPAVDEAFSNFDARVEQIISRGN